MDTNSPSEDQAVQGDDYLPTTSSVVMVDGITSAAVPITVLYVSQSSTVCLLHTMAVLAVYFHEQIQPCTCVVNETQTS